VTSPECVEAETRKRALTYHLTSIPENDVIGHIHQRLEALRRKLSGEEVNIAGVGASQAVNKLRRDFRRSVGMGVTIPGAGPVDPGEGEPGRAIRILHGKERGEVVFFRVAGFWGEAGEAELVPEAEVTHDQARVPAGEGEELGADAEGGEGHFGEHGGTREVARVEVGVLGEDLDEAAVGKGGVFEEVVVDEGEGVEGDAVLGEENEVEVEGVVEECGGDEAAGGGDERGGGTGGGF